MEPQQVTLPSVRTAHVCLAPTHTCCTTIGGGCSKPLASQQVRPQGPKAHACSAALPCASFTSTKACASGAACVTVTKAQGSGTATGTALKDDDALTGPSWP